MAPSGLAAPSSADATAPSTSPASPVSCKRSCSEASQFETTTSRRPAARSARSAGALSGYAVKASASSSAAVRPAAGASAAARAERGPHRLGAARAQRGERRRVAAEVEVRAVERDLRAHGRARVRVRHLDPEPPAQRGAQPRRGIAEAEQGAHRVEQDRR